jgi:hypothetical protein
MEYTGRGSSAPRASFTRVLKIQQAHRIFRLIGCALIFRSATAKSCETANSEPLLALHVFALSVPLQQLLHCIHKIIGRTEFVEISRGHQVRRFMFE